MTERDRLVRRQDDAERHCPVGRSDLEPRLALPVRPPLHRDESAVLDPDRLRLAHRRVPPPRPPRSHHGPSRRVAVSLARSGLRPATLAIVGWFGPRGLASWNRSCPSLYLVPAQHPRSRRHRVYPLARRYGELLAATRDQAAEEHQGGGTLLLQRREAVAPQTRQARR